MVRVQARVQVRVLARVMTRVRITMGCMMERGLGLGLGSVSVSVSGSGEWSVVSSSCLHLESSLAWSENSAYLSPTGPSS